MRFTHAVRHAYSASTSAAIAFGALTLLLVGCGGGGDSTPTPPTPPPSTSVASVTVALSASTLTIGQNATATATLRSASGAELSGRTISWSSSNSSVATVSASGQVTAVASGSASIIATSEGQTGSASLTVAPIPVASVTVALSAASVMVGQTVNAVATMKSAAGAELTGRTVAWTTSSAAIATISPSGVITSVAPGSVTITGTSEGIAGTASLTITAVPVASVTVALSAASVVAGQTSNATASARSAAGAELTGRSVTWTSSNTAIATVASSGVVTSLAQGTTTITATVEGITGSATLTVTPVPVATVAVALSASSVAVGLTSTATATLRSAAGAVLTERTVTWSTANAAVATVNANGVVTAVAVGTTAVRATSEGQTGSANITVTAAPVASIVLSTDSSDVPIRTSLQLTASPRDANGNALTGRTVTWSLSPAGIATVNASGLVRVIQPGTVTVTATSEGRTATARLRGTVAVLTAFVDSIRLAHGMPAMGGAIVSREGLIGIGVAGTRRISGGNPVTVNDKWHLGSNTKALTGFLAGMAVQAGVISWEKTVEEGFPDLNGVMRAEYRPVPLKELLSHTSGVVNNNIGLTASPSSLPASRTAWANAAVQQAPNNERGVYYYSNTAFGMAGAMIERAWGSSFEQLMQEKIFGPLNLQNVGWGPTTTPGANDQPQGHSLQGSTWVTCEGCDNLPGLSAAGTAHMPLGSWARMMQEVLLADQGRSSLMTQATSRYLTTNQVPLSAGHLYGMGWQVGGAVGTRHVVHDGSNVRNHSRAILFLDSGVGFLITINAADLDGGRTGAAITALQQRMDRYWQTGN